MRLSQGPAGLVASLLLVSTAALAADQAALPPEMPAGEREKLQGVIDAAIVTGRYESPPFPARRDIFEYLIDHPEFASHVTRVLRVARYRVWSTSEGLFLDDGWGVRGHFAVVHAESGLRVLRARGYYEQTLVPTINGEAVVVFRYGPSAPQDGKAQLATTISGYLRIENRVYAAAIRLAKPIAKAKADLEARRLLKVFARVSRAIEENPARVYELVRQSPDVPQRDLEGFRRVLNLPRVTMP